MVLVWSYEQLTSNKRIEGLALSLCFLKVRIYKKCITQSTIIYYHLKAAITFWHHSTYQTKAKTFIFQNMLSIFWTSWQTFGLVDVASHKSDWTSRLCFGLVGLVSHLSDRTSGQASFSWRLQMLAHLPGTIILGVHNIMAMITIGNESVNIT